MYIAYTTEFLLGRDLFGTFGFNVDDDSLNSFSEYSVGEKVLSDVLKF